LKKRKDRWRKKAIMDLWYKLWKRYTVHPILRTHFFDITDNKAKAYWLGFLYTDGFIERTPHSIGIHIELNRNDEDVIDRFCDCLRLNKERKDTATEEAEETQLKSDLVAREWERISLIMG
jgi:hypothetical protein